MRQYGRKENIKRKVDVVVTEKENINIGDGVGEE